MNKHLFFSVIIPSLNREDALCNTVKHLLEQHYSNFEIVIVDQSDLKNTARINSLLKEINGRRKYVRYIHIDQKGLPNARNVGIKNSHGDIVLFLDDDVIPDNNLIKFHAQNYSNPKIGAVGGRIIEQPDLITNYKRKPGGSIALSGRPLRNFNSSKKGFMKWAPGGNMSFRKELIPKVGWFDERFIGTSVQEDVDFSCRIRKAGYEIMYEPNAIILHLREYTNGCRENNTIKREYFRFHNYALFFFKNMPKVLLPYFIFVFLGINIKNLVVHHYSWSQFNYILKGLHDGYKTYKNQI